MWEHVSSPLHFEIHAAAKRNIEGHEVENSVRVLQVNKLYAPWIGGVEAVVQDIAEGLRDMPGIECKVLVCRDRGRTQQSILNGVEVERVASAGRFLSMPIAPSFPVQLSRMASHFEVIHVHIPFPLVMFCDWRGIKARGSRLVVHYHSDICRPVQKFALSCFSALERRFLEAADVIIVTSQGLMENSKTLEPYRKKCKVVPLSIDLDNLRVATPLEISNCSERYGILDGEPVVLFAGRLVYYKGIEYLIEAAKDLSAKVLIAGDGPLRSFLDGQVAKAGLGHRIQFLGRVTDAELAALYSLSDVFVLPSTEPSEAFGLVQLEAMARGLPVINTDLPTGVPFISLDGVSGVTVAPRDSAALRHAIAEVIDNPELRNRFSENARQRAQLFSRKVVLDQIMSIYQNLTLGMGAR